MLDSTVSFKLYHFQSVVYFKRLNVCKTVTIAKSTSLVK